MYPKAALQDCKPFSTSVYALLHKDIADTPMRQPSLRSYCVLPLLSWCLGELHATTTDALPIRSAPWSKRNICHPPLTSDALLATGRHLSDRLQEPCLQLLAGELGDAPARTGWDLA